MRKTWAAGVGIALDHDGDVPIGVQLDWTLRAAIASGRLRPGERLPGLREVADQLGISHNTLRAAVAKLESDGLLETRHGAGTYVAATTSADAATQTALVDDTAARARAAGITPRDLATALYVTGAAPPDAAPADLNAGVEGAATDARSGAGAGAARSAHAGAARAARSAHSGAGADAADLAARRALRDELAVLDRILIDLEERLPERLPGGDYEWKSRGARLLSTAELRAQRDAVIRRIAAAQHALDATADPSTATEPSAAEDTSPATEPRCGTRSTTPRRRPGTAPA